MSIDWANNYVIKSVKSRPILFILAAFISMMATYTIMDNYQERLIETNREERFKLEKKILSLESEINTMSLAIEEEFDEETGKLIRKRINKETYSEKKTKREVATIKEEIIAEARKEWTKSRPKNYLYVGIGSDLDLNKSYYVGLAREFWLFDIGLLFDYREQGSFSEQSAAITLGIRF